MPAARTLARLSVLVGLTSAAIPSALAQAGPVTRRTCAPIAGARAPTFTFGNHSGLLRPQTTTIGADGTVKTGGDTASDTIGRIPAASVAALAGRAATRGLLTVLMPAIRPPLRNPDAARQFIRLRLSCGTRTLEYLEDAAPPVVLAFRATLDSILQHAVR